MNDEQKFIAVRLDELILDLLMFHIKLLNMKKTHKHTPQPHNFGKGGTTIIGDAMKAAGQFKKPAPAVDKHMSKGDSLI